MQWSWHTQTIELPDTSLLAVFYGPRLDAARSVRPKMECWCLRSTDGGKTWKFRGLIARNDNEPQAGFVCADCDARCRTDAARVRDVTAAQITDRGAAYLRSGHAGLGRQRAMFRFSDLPLDMIVALNRAASAWNEHRTPFALARIAHDRLFELQETQGARQVAEARRLWLSSLREALGEGSVCATGRNDDYALLSGKDTDAAERRLEAARARADRDIRFDLGSTVRLFGPEDLAR